MGSSLRARRRVRASSFALVGCLLPGVIAGCSIGGKSAQFAYSYGISIQDQSNFSLGTVFSHTEYARIVVKVSVEESAVPVSITFSVTATQKPNNYIRDFGDFTTSPLAGGTSQQFVVANYQPWDRGSWAVRIATISCQATGGTNCQPSAEIEGTAFVVT